MEIVIRSAIAFIVLWLLARASGRRTLGELSSFDLLLFIVMGDLIQQGVTAEDRTLTGGLLAVGTFTLLAVAANFAMARWPRVGHALEGAPVIIISDGKVQERALKRQRLSREELMASARQAGYMDLEKVKLAVLEQNGKMSFFGNP